MAITTNEYGPINTDLMPVPVPVQPGEAGVVNPVDGRLMIDPESGKAEHAPEDTVRVIGSLAAQSGIQLKGFEMPGTEADPDVRGHSRDEQGRIVPLYRGVDGRPTMTAPVNKDVMPGSFGPSGAPTKVPDFQQGYARAYTEVPTSQVRGSVARGETERFAHGVPGAEAEQQQRLSASDVARPGYRRQP